MCYSKYWQADEERKRQEATAREAHERRAEVINNLWTDGGKQAEKAKKDVPATVPAK
jgi:hypothetical protein